MDGTGEETIMSRQTEATIPHKTKLHLQWSELCEALAERCRGEPAKLMAHQLEPAASMREARRRLTLVDEARALLDQDQRPPLGQPVSLSEALIRAGRGGVLNPEELIMIGNQVNNAVEMARFLKMYEKDYPALGDLAVGLTERRDLSAEIRNSFDAHGEVSDLASGDLGELRGRVRAMHGQLKERVDHLLKDEGLTTMLQDDFYTLREDRYVLPVKSGHKRHVEGIVHGWSSSGATVFIEPQVVVEANNRLRMAQAEEKQEVHRILTRLSKRVGQHSEALQVSQEALIELDYTFATAHLSKDLNCHSPHLIEEAQLNLPQARHPLLALAGVGVVPNDIELGGEVAPVLIITGPNAGGKTVVMKTTGLLVMMSLAGLHIPTAAGALVPWIPGLFSDIGDEQSLAEGQSTFSGHLSNLKGIMRRLRPKSIVLLDELAIGTDPLQGSALAQAVLEHFVESGSLVMTTTHFEALKLLSTEDERFRNGAVEYDEQAGGPTYRLRYDMPGSSSAIQIAEKLGLPAPLIQRATALIGEQHKRLEDAIARLEKEVVSARAAKKTAEEEARRLKSLNQQVAQKERSLKERLQRAVSSERSAAIQEARALRDRVKALKDQLRTEASTATELAEVERDLTQSADQLASEHVADQMSAYPIDLDPATLTLGQQVWVITLDMHASLIRLPDSRGRCAVQAGLMKIDVDVAALRQARSTHKKTSKLKGTGSETTKKKKRSGERPESVSWDQASPQTTDNTLDVRGQRSDEAVASIIDFLDGVYGRGGNAAYLIHGHGTGALKKHIRGWLPSCDYVANQRAGQQSEGGDGVTVVLLTRRAL